MNRTSGSGRRGLACLAAALAFVGAPGQAQTIAYAYDEIGQVKTATYPNGTVITYSYDAAGNLTQHVSAANQPPDAVNDSISTPKNIAKTFDPRTNDSDPNGNPITITTKTNGTNGTVVINSGVSLTYAPATNYTGPDSFTYTISDSYGGTDTATVSVTVTSS